MKPIMGAYQGAVRDYLNKQKYPLSYLSDEFNDVAAWQDAARAKVRELLSYSPPKIPFDAQVHDEYVKGGLIYQHVSYAQPFGPRTEGILMRPAGRAQPDGGRLPGILALHDHGGFKYYGKEKITSPKALPSIMVDFQEQYYGGRGWAHELARRGYAVFVPDVFLWGSRKINIDDVPAWYAAAHESLTPHGGLMAPEGSDEYIGAYNNFAGFMESDIAKTLIEAGTTWPGFMVSDDMRALDFLLSQPYVDPENVGCGGLSGGGCRTVFLAAMDERVKCSVCAGFMTTSEDFALNKVHTHTWMMYLPGLTNLMDFTDLYSLHGKKPTMVLYDADDELFTPAGMWEADARFRRIYAKMGAPELYRGHFFPGPHKFDVEMQEIAFDFYDEWLKP